MAAQAAERGEKNSMISTIFNRAFKVLMKKPVKLWAICLLSMLLNSLAVALCGAAIPILGIAVSMLFTVSMTMIFLHGYRGEEVEVVHLFECFKDWNTIKRVLLGMGWMTLWITLWGLIPFAGPVFAIIRAYEYRLTPYILVTEPEISVTDAIKVSSERTNGYKLQMFLADFLVALVVGLVDGILTALAMIPIIGIVFALATLALAALAPLFTGLIQAAFYEEIKNPTIPVTTGAAAPAAAAFCPNCGSAMDAGAKFCPRCGQQIG